MLIYSPSMILDEYDAGIKPDIAPEYAKQSADGGGGGIPKPPLFKFIATPGLGWVGSEFSTMSNSYL